MSTQEQVRRKLTPWFSSTLTSHWLRDTRRLLASVQRYLSGAPRRIAYFHQADDPYSHLAAQTLEHLRKRYDIELEIQLVGQPPEDAAPERERLAGFARKDAADIAPGYGLAFPPGTEAPEAAAVALANRILAGAIEADCFVDAAVRVGDALWARDTTTLEALAREFPTVDEAAAEAALARGNEQRSTLGHYLGAMFYDAPEWYWGVDRLHYLEERLAADGARRNDAPSRAIVEPPLPSRKRVASKGDRRLSLEFYPSLRSPYTWIVMERVFDLSDRYPVDILTRPVLPMVMRGLPVPLSKQLYIQFDTKREADRVGVAFGNVCDPVGEPVERGFSLWGWARAQGLGNEFLTEFARGAFSEGIDMATSQGLKIAANRAGLDWDHAQVDADGWREELENNRRTLFELGLWGVPSFRILGDERHPDFATWGQDRLWLIEREIERRLAD